jgi:hypothetical protein
VVARSPKSGGAEQAAERGDHEEHGDPSTTHR